MTKGFHRFTHLLPPDPASNRRRRESRISSDLFIFFLLIQWSIVFLSDLKSERCSSTVEVARNIRRWDELMYVGMLLLDSNVSFRIPNCLSKLNISHVSYLLQFSLKNTHKYLYCIDRDVYVTFSLSAWCSKGCYCDKLKSLKYSENVLSVSNKSSGRLFLNATSGTHIYFDKETNVRRGPLLQVNIVKMHLLVSTDTGLQSVAPLLKGYATVENLTISELNEFVIAALSQDIDFMCSGKVTDIKMDKGWCYIACSKCTKKLLCTDSALTCVHCDNTHAVGALWYVTHCIILFLYRVEMGIADDSAEGVFVCFDGVMTKLHNLKAHDAGHMLARAGVNPEDTQCIQFHGKLSDLHHHTHSQRAPLPDFVDNGGNEKNGDDMPSDNTVRAKIETGGSTPNGEEPKRPSAKAAFKMVKKARLA
ncbi:hypothetical protein HID58_087495 [Brassica napus]|uniref:Replication factor A C-terminal domain-containing protein n=1 Tax=Brassica napus TaxID=3708 RepID=A0ABQ7XTF5_BRANA|nr:hypothetical protein HID58_087495 [Brassica napus]